jgi:hypothetical protein
MNQLPFTYKNRREFIKTCLRFGIGGGLVFAGIALGRRKNTGGNENEICQFRSPCQNCSKYSGCNLPQALLEKKENNPEGGKGGRK